MMHKKLPGYGVAGFVIIVVFLTHNILGRNDSGVAIATPSSYADQTAIPVNTIRLLKNVSYRPENFLEVTAQDVRALLSEPEMVREDLPTAVWQYRTDSCVLDLYMKESGADDPHAPVVHYEIRARGGEAADYKVQRNCIRGLIEQRSSPRMVDVSAIYKRAD